MHCSTSTQFPWQVRTQTLLTAAAVLLLTALGVTHVALGGLPWPPWMMTLLTGPWVLLVVLVGSVIGWYRSQLREAELALALARQSDEADRRLQLVVERGVDGLMLIDRSLRLVYVSPPAERWLGIAVGAGLRAAAATAGKGGQALVDAIAELAERPGGVHHGEYFFGDSAATATCLEVSAANDLDAAGVGVMVVRLRDVSKERALGVHARGMERMYRLVSASNQAIVRAISTRELHEALCKAAVEVGGFPMAWIGHVPDRNARAQQVCAISTRVPEMAQKVLPAIEAGDTQGVGNLSALAADRPSVIYNDLQRDPSLAHWQPLAKALGLQAFAAFAIRVNKQVWGALNLCAEQIGFFDTSEAALLQELADDVGFALEVSRRDRERVLAETMLARAEASFKALAHFDDLESTLTDAQAMQWIVDAAELLTDSRAGYLHLVDADQRTLHLTTWSTATRGGCAAQAGGHASLDAAGIWADCVRTHKPVLHNDYPAVAKPGALPKGHFALQRHVSVPAVEDGRVHAVLGVGNREQPYGEVDVRTLQLLAGRVSRTLKMRADTRALRDSERRYRLVFDHSPHPMWIYDVATLQFLLVNQATIDVYGWTAAEFAELTLFAIRPEAEQTQLAADRKRLAETEERCAELRHRTRKGAILHVEVRSRPMRYEGRQARLVLAVDMTERALRAQDDRERMERVQEITHSVIKVIANIGAFCDPYTQGHERRVGLVAEAIGNELGLSTDHCEALRVAGFLHDVGKIGVPAEILAKPGKLSHAEYALVQEHCLSGHRILRDMALPWPVADVALQHHERWDGSGYPAGLVGHAILLDARIIAVADVLEAMASHRPYRAAIGFSKALAELESGAGVRYDPEVAAACLRLFRLRGFELPQ